MFAAGEFEKLNNKILLSINVKTQCYLAVLYRASIPVWKETILMQIIFAKPVFQIKRVFIVFECVGNKDSFVSQQSACWSVQDLKWAGRG